MRSLRGSHCIFSCVDASFIVWYCRPLSLHMSSARAPPSRTSPPPLLITFIMSSSRQSLASLIFQHCRHVMTRVIGAHAHAWTRFIRTHTWTWTRLVGTYARLWLRFIVVRVAARAVEQAREFAVDRAARFVSFSFHFGCADVYQGGRGVCDCRERVPRRRRQSRPPPHTRRIEAYPFHLGRGLTFRPCRPFVGKGCKFFFLSFFWLKHLLTLCHTASRFDGQSGAQALTATTATSTPTPTTAMTTTTTTVAATMTTTLAAAAAAAATMGAFFL